MRDRETIDSELRRIALERRSVGERGSQPSIREVDELLDERLGHRPQAPATQVLADPPPQRATRRNAPFSRKGVSRRFGLLAALPLSLIAGAAAVVVMSGAHHPEPAAEPAAVPPPSSVRPVPAAPAAQAPQLDIVDRALIGALKHDGVPVPSPEYVTAHGHAVCDFLSRQPDFAEAIRFVQRSTIWDANQSANFVGGAVVSYCPQYEQASPGELQPGLQKSLSDLQAVQGDLQGIQGDLQNIKDGLPALPGQP
ncbi:MULTISPECIES: DUF732 domain-containing protein [Mycobacterium]|uniref:DUF732 domain-containing protein n=1 Tax=Mycobacterium terramassiliense TaxID=1841859 RepID=A0A2U3NG55_9MYCO|nr:MULTISPECIES: DUF732 domain-containing protein [Mycobacterium]MCV7090979.1 DUF732 domain-containing protein [Mycobacterium interjectum]ORV86923.1 hypothetical protein AWC11_15930 [Mycobacterium interjectum]SPM30403.1 hypothetical protein BN971_02178 [Mycobacterium terramassiliense]